MPNHVTHKMVFENDVCDALIMEMKIRKDPEFKGGLLDFNFFCPMPRPWNYEVAIRIHGTKWNAYDQDMSQLKEGILFFQTAWSTASPVWVAMAAQHPDVHITIYYADEDTGNNLGIITIKDGEAELNELSAASNADKIGF